jgi:hypothetical protein
MPRFAILEHTGAPDDPAGLHYDLLLEAGSGCRTWRLAELPQPGGPPVAAAELPVHRLAWLDHEAGAVSGGRGFARRIDAGSYQSPPTAPRETDLDAEIDVLLQGERVVGRLALRGQDGCWTAMLLSQGTQRSEQHGTP